METPFPAPARQTELSASSFQQAGRHNSIPVARNMARPSCICASPSSWCPCAAIAQPRTGVAQAKASVNPCLAQSAIALSALLSGACSPPILTQNADEPLGPRQTKGMGQALSQG